MGITPYRAPFSTNVERVSLALAYKGLRADPVEIDYSDRSTVIAVSGQGLVPVVRPRLEGAAQRDRGRSRRARGRDARGPHGRLARYVRAPARGPRPPLGDFSAADCVAFPFLKYARPEPPPDDDPFHLVLAERQSLESRAKLAAWIERVDARPRA